MKKLIMSILSIMMSITLLTGADKVPEFDGCYIKLTSGKFVEMKLQKARKTYINGTSWDSFMDPSRQVFYVTDKHSITSVNSGEVLGIAWRESGISYVKDAVSIHPLVIKTKAECILPNGVKKAYGPGRKIETRSKLLGQDTYYFKPRNKLPDGEYVVWLGKTFYLFRVAHQSLK